jgi:hypothetical protein
MRTLTGITAILLVQLFAGCDKTSPAAPTPMPPAAPAPAPAVPAASGEKWSLTTTITSVTGPAACVRGPVSKLPIVSNWLLTVERSGDSLRLLASGVSDPSDSYEYNATVAGPEFSGTGTPDSGYVVCGESVSDQLSYRGADSLVGRFSADRNTLTADEELMLQLSSGDVVTYHTEWRATKR